jgi:hypothetical protein
VQSLDEGSSVTCTVDAVNAAGFGTLAATSAGVRIAVPFVANCPAATGSISGATLGLAKLGETRGHARQAYRHSSVRSRAYEDFFCLTPVGVRVGYASPKALAGLPMSQRAALLRRVIWISTSSPYYAISGVRPGATIVSAGQVLPLGKVFQIGLNDWYLAPVGSVTVILKVRGGIVQEIGIANRQLTRGRAAQSRFLTSFS